MDLIQTMSYEKMSKIDLPENERAWVAQKATDLEKSFEELEKINTADVLPLVSVLDMTNVLREDKVEKLLSREKILENSPEQYDGYFQVPKTLE